MLRLFRSSRPGKAEYVSLVLFLLAWIAAMVLIALPQAQGISLVRPVPQLHGR